MGLPVCGCGSVRPVPAVDLDGCSDIHVGTFGEFPPEVEIAGRATRVLAEQTAAVDAARLGASVGQLSFDELRHVDAALRLVLDL